MSESKYVSALPKILNGPSFLTLQSAMFCIIFGPLLTLLRNVHLFSWLFWCLVGVDMWFEFDDGHVKKFDEF